MRVKIWLDWISNHLRFCSWRMVRIFLSLDDVALKSTLRPCTLHVERQTQDFEKILDSSSPPSFHQNHQFFYFQFYHFETQNPTSMLHIPKWVIPIFSSKLSTRLIPLQEHATSFTSTYPYFPSSLQITHSPTVPPPYHLPISASSEELQLHHHQLEIAQLPLPIQLLLQVHQLLKFQGVSRKTPSN